MGGDKGVHTFPKGISPKVNIIVWLEFELFYFEATVHSISPLRQKDSVFVTSMSAFDISAPITHTDKEHNYISHQISNRSISDN